MTVPTTSQPMSPIENEIPAYRAISSLAVLSVVLGIASVFTFAHIGFIVFGIGAIVCGVIALRGIRRHPDMMTGASLANVGVALGVVFSLSAATFLATRSIQVQRSAQTFAEGYARVLDSNDLVTAIWYRMPANQRPGEKQSAHDELMNNPDPETRMRVAGPIQEIQRRSSLPGGNVELVRLEHTGYEGITPYAIALVRIQSGEGADGEAHSTDDGHDHSGHDHGPVANREDGLDFAMLELRSLPPSRGRGFAWYVNEIIYPYQPDTYTPAPKPLDDGHNH